MPAEDADTDLLSLGIGLGLERAVHDDLPVTPLTNLVRVLIGLAVQAS
jgi:hypothetical protein